MSRATLRAAMVAKFGKGAVDGLTDVFPSEKKLTNADEFYLKDGDRSGALAFVFIEHEAESRMSLAGTSQGYKRIEYNVALVCMFRHGGVDPSDQEDAGFQAMDDWDATVEGIKQFIRNDRTLGGAVFQIGEGNTLHGPDIEIVSDLPSTDPDNGSIQIWTAIRFQVIEITNP